MMDKKLKTGTTCIGFKFDGGILLAADRRVTGGIMENDFIKIFPLTKKIIATIAGTASTCQLVLRHLEKDISLFELENEREINVCEVVSMTNLYQYSILRNQGEIVGLLIGGYDEKDEFSLYDMSPDGTLRPQRNYVSNGSGSIFIKGIFDTEYRPNISEKESLLLVEKSFKVAFKNDEASGGGFIAKLITKAGVKDFTSKVVKTEFVEEKN